jgi:hypothetical protein
MNRFAFFSDCIPVQLSLQQAAYFWRQRHQFYYKPINEYDLMLHNSSELED